MKKLVKELKSSSLAGTVFTGYGELLAEIKTRIRAAQIRAAFASNAEMLQLYWEVGALLIQKQKQVGWGMRVLCQLAQDLHNDLPDVKGFSERNLRLMTRFFREYPDFSIIWQQAVAKLEEAGPGLGSLAFMMDEDLFAEVAAKRFCNNLKITLTDLILQLPHGLQATSYIEQQIAEMSLSSLVYQYLFHSRFYDKS